jgi:hypothetical protein
VKKPSPALSSPTITEAYQPLGLSGSVSTVCIDIARAKATPYSGPGGDHGEPSWG